MAESQAELVKSLVDAGVHFGHRVSRWNPKMEPYIHGKRNMIHIIDVKETIKGLLRAKKLMQNMVAGGKDILFVGTKRQARHAIQEEAARCGMHHVSERWLGGTLTNFRTIRARLNRLDQLDGPSHAYMGRWRLGGTRANNRTSGAPLPRLEEVDRRWDIGAIVAGRRLHLLPVVGLDRDKIKTNLEGIRKMERMPGAMF